MSNYYKEQKIVFNKINSIVELLPTLEEVNINSMCLDLLTDHEISEKAILKYLGKLELAGKIKISGGNINLP